MKVFLPFQPIENPYLDEIKNHFQGVFTYGNYNEYNQTYDVVNIHWPEAIFNWKEPSLKQLEELESKIKYWKKTSKVVYTRHNLIPHYSDTKKFRKLYEIVIALADGVIHLGAFSLNEFKHKSVTYQKIIEHPLYSSTPNKTSKIKARELLSIKQNANVMLVFGKIRSKEEKEIIFKAFRKLKLKNKVLLIPSMQYFFSNKIPRKFLVLIRYVFKAYYKLHPNYCLLNKFVKTENIQNYFTATDVVFVARTINLNSGNLFLGLTFKNIVVGPNIGNIQNVLNKLKLPTYIFNDIDNVTASINEGFNIASKGFNNYISAKQLEVYNPKYVAKEYFNFFNCVLNE